MSDDLSLVSQGGDAYQRVLDQLGTGGRLRWFFRKPHPSWSPELREAMWVGREYRSASARLGMVAGLPGTVFALVAVFYSLGAGLIVFAGVLVAMLIFGPSYERGLWAMSRTRVQRAARKRGQADRSS